MINLEIENDGNKCTVCKLNGTDIGTGIYAIDLHIVGGEKPKAIITCNIDTLKLNGFDVDLFKSKKESRIRKWLDGKAKHR